MMGVDNFKPQLRFSKNKKYVFYAHCIEKGLEAMGINDLVAFNDFVQFSYEIQINGGL
tara:strand:+ start:919 stop:1092 length:174 start_codon:yes stop_codon:yes gene_type:complete